MNSSDLCARPVTSAVAHRQECTTFVLPTGDRVVRHRNTLVPAEAEVEASYAPCELGFSRLLRRPEAEASDTAGELGVSIGFNVAASRTLLRVRRNDDDWTRCASRNFSRNAAEQRRAGTRRTDDDQIRLLLGRSGDEPVRRAANVNQPIGAAVGRCACLGQSMESLGDRANRLLRRTRLEHAYEHQPEAELAAERASDARRRLRGVRVVDAANDRARQRNLPRLLASRFAVLGHDHYRGSNPSPWAGLPTWPHERNSSEEDENRNAFVVHEMVLFAGRDERGITRFQPAAIPLELEGRFAGQDNVDLISRVSRGGIRGGCDTDEHADLEVRRLVNDLPATTLAFELRTNLGDREVLHHVRPEAPEGNKLSPLASRSRSINGNNRRSSARMWLTSNRPSFRMIVETSPSEATRSCSCAACARST